MFPTTRVQSNFSVVVIIVVVVIESELLQAEVGKLFALEEEEASRFFCFELDDDRRARTSAGSWSRASRKAVCHVDIGVVVDGDASLVAYLGNYNLNGLIIATLRHVC